MITTAPRSALPRGWRSSAETDRPRCVPPNRSPTLALARARATSAERWDNAGVSRVSDVANANTSGRIPDWRSAAARIKCR